MKAKKQIVITGYSAISSIGLNKEENRQKLFAGETRKYANTLKLMPEASIITLLRGDRNATPVYYCALL